MDDLAAFIEWLLQDGLSPVTVKNHASAVKNLFLFWNIPKVIKIFNSYTWSLTLKAVSHAVRETPVSTPAMTLSHLGALLRACDTDKSMIPLKVALSFGYLGYLRVSNLAPNSENSFDPTRSTTWGDIWPSRDGIIVALKWTKTRQTNMDRVTVPLPALGASEFCPLRIWRCYTPEVSDLCLAPSDPLLLSTVHPVEYNCFRVFLSVNNN